MDELRNAAKWLSVAGVGMSLMLVCLFLTPEEIAVFFVAAAFYFCAMETKKEGRRDKKEHQIEW